MRAYPHPPDIEAEITFVPTEDGGRKTAAFSGYRPQFYYDGQDWVADHEYPDVESVLPGQTARALLRFLNPDMHLGRVHTGLIFLVREGSRVVASGRVTKILHLAESAERVKNKSDSTSSKISTVKEQHAEMVRVAYGILDGSMGIVAGARQLTGLRFRSRLENDTDIMIFVGIDSETGHLPLGNVRRHWNVDALKDKDKELKHYEARVKDRALRACKNFIAKHGYAD